LLNIKELIQRDVQQGSEVKNANVVFDPYADGYLTELCRLSTDAEVKSVPRRNKMTAGDMQKFVRILGLSIPIEVASSYNPEIVYDYIRGHMPLKVEIDNHTMDRSDVWAAWRLNKNVSRSRYMAGAQMKEDYARYSNLVPLGMLGFLESYGIKYSNWQPPVVECGSIDELDTCISDTTREAYKVLMGCGLVNSESYDILTMSTYPELLEFNNGVRQEVLIDSNGAYNLNKHDPKNLSDAWGLYAAIWNRTIKPVRCIILQSHVANRVYRNTNMILDLKNWDRVPQARDGSNTVMVKKII
jgi:hypothetical protein